MSTTPLAASIYVTREKGLFHVVVFVPDFDDLPNTRSRFLRVGLFIEEHSAQMRIMTTFGNIRAAGNTYLK